MTVSGAVNRPGVHEVELGLPISDAGAPGRRGRRLRAVLIGGLGGSWLPIADAVELPLAHDLRRRGHRARRGRTRGAARAACGIAETAAVLRYLPSGCGGAGRASSAARSPPTSTRWPWARPAATSCPDGGSA